MGDPVSLPMTGSRASPKPWWTLFSLLLILLISPDTLDGQLIGSRGVFTLPEGMEYRDALTRDASRSASQNYTVLILPPFLQGCRRLCHELPGEGGHAGKGEVQEEVQGSGSKACALLRSQTSGQRETPLAQRGA